MKVIETEYKGYRFRSRLEARWAVFFDACGVKWEYEPEGFDLGDGLYYLPDFLLHDVYILHGGGEIPRYFGDLWVEVKGRMTKEDSEKISAFVTDNYAEQINFGTDVEPIYFGEYYLVNSIIILPNIPDGDNIRAIDEYIFNISYGNNSLFPYYGIYPFNFNNIDGDWYTAFPCIDKQRHFTIVGEQYTDCRDDKATEKAYRLARQARFEHR